MFMYDIILYPIQTGRVYSNDEGNNYRDKFVVSFVNDF